jgi:hypothetical protein
MSNEMFQTLRFLMPGLIIAVGCVAPLFFGTVHFAETIRTNEKLLLWIVPPVVGVFYYLLHLRRYFMANPLEQIDGRIEDALLAPFNGHAVIGPAASQLRTSRRVMNIFYQFLDNDKSLTERAKGAYLNGLVLSSLADLRAITFLLLPVYLGAWIFTKNGDFGWYLLAAIGLHVIAIPLMKTATAKHISLGTNQTDYIVQFKRPELAALLIAASTP